MILTTRDAAHELGLSVKRVGQLILTGKLRATKAGGRDWRIEHDALDAVRVRPGPGWPKGRARGKRSKA